MQLDGATDRHTTLRLRSRLRARQPPSRPSGPATTRRPPRRSAAPRPRPGAIRCHKNTCLKARTKDLTLKAKDRTENVALKASARNKDQTLKAKASTKD